MTTLAPSAAPQPAESPAPTVRQYIRYLFYKAAPSWRQLSTAERDAARNELLTTLEPFVERLAVLRAFSTLGTRADTDFVLWMVSERLQGFHELRGAAPRAPTRP